MAVAVVAAVAAKVSVRNQPPILLAADSPYDSSRQKAGSTGDAAPARSWLLLLAAAAMVPTAMSMTCPLHYTQTGCVDGTVHANSAMFSGLDGSPCCCFRDVMGTKEGAAAVPNVSHTAPNTAPNHIATHSGVGGVCEYGTTQGGLIAPIVGTACCCPRDGGLASVGAPWCLTPPPTLPPTPVPTATTGTPPPTPSPTPTNTITHGRGLASSIAHRGATSPVLRHRDQGTRVIVAVGPERLLRCIMRHVWRRWLSDAARP